MAKVVLITGASSGVGLTLSVLLARSVKPTYKVVATMRNLSKKENLLKAAGDTFNKTLFLKQLDVCDSKSVESVVQEILKEDGRIDVLVNNAGVGLSGPVELLTVDQAKENFETNFFGVFRTTNAVLPSMKAKESGHIVQVSSMGGVRGVPFNDVYCAAKFAVEGFSESLAPLLRCFNIKVTVIEPGPILTDFVENATKQSAGGGEVTALQIDEKTKQKFTAVKTKMLAGFNPTFAETAEQCAGKIKEAIDSENPPFRLQTNANYIPLAKSKFTDPTGNSGIDDSFKLFFS